MAPKRSLRTLSPTSPGPLISIWREGPGALGAPPRTFYDHASDPHEWHNLAGRDTAKEVIAEHARWLPVATLPGLTLAGTSACVNIKTVPNARTPPVNSVGGWKRCRISLPFRAGGVSLGDFEMDVATMTAPYLELSPTMGHHFPRDAIRELGTKTAVIHSCPINERMDRISFSSDGLRYVPEHFPRHHTDVHGEFKEYLKRQFSSKSRSTLLRKVNKIARRNCGRLDIREYRRANELMTWHRLARAISSKTYQERLLNCGLPNTPEFLHELRDQAQEDSFRGYLLFDQDTAIAFLACPITDQGTMLYEHVGFDPAFKALSPGTVLLYGVLEKAFSDQMVHTFDFTEGDGAHKLRFATHTTECADVWFFAPNVGLFALVAAHATLRGMHGLAAAILERADLKDSMRRLLRKTSHRLATRRPTHAAPYP